jgi:hypothetical protein
MKKIIFIIALFSSLHSFAQTANTFVFTQFASSRVRASDSIQVSFQLSTNNPKTAFITSIVQTAGPTVKFTPDSSWISGTTVNRGFWLQGLAPGTYTFTATGVSGSGTTGQQTETFTVIPDQVCPPIPAPRLLSSVTIRIGLQTITLSAAELQSIKYVDGSTQ